MALYNRPVSLPVPTRFMNDMSHNRPVSPRFMSDMNHNRPVTPRLVSDTNEPHGFDQPYQVIRKLRQDVQDLTDAFKAEQKQRALEVTELRDEILGLKETLSKLSNEHHTTSCRLQQDLDILRSENIKAVDELASIFSRSMEDLNQILQDEIRDRKADCMMRDSREANERSERQRDMDTLLKELDDRKNEYSSYKENTSTSIANLNHDVEMIASTLSKVGTAKGTLSSGKLLCAKYFRGGGGLVAGRSS